MRPSNMFRSTVLMIQTSKTFLKEACTAQHSDKIPRRNRFEAKASLLQKTQEMKGPKAVTYKQAKPLRV